MMIAWLNATDIIWILFSIKFHDVELQCADTKTFDGIASWKRTIFQDCNEQLHSTVYKMMDDGKGVIIN